MIKGCNDLWGNYAIYNNINFLVITTIVFVSTQYKKSILLRDKGDYTIWRIQKQNKKKSQKITKWVWIWLIWKLETEMAYRETRKLKVKVEAKIMILMRNTKRVVRNLDVGQSSTQNTKGIKRWNFVWNNVGEGSDEGSYGQLCVYLVLVLCCKLFLHKL